MNYLLSVRFRSIGPQTPNLMHLGEAINFRVLDEESAVIPLVRIAAVHFNAETKS